MRIPPPHAVGRSASSRSELAGWGGMNSSRLPTQWGGRPARVASSPGGEVRAQRAALVNDHREDDRAHPERQPDRDQADLFVAPADGAEHEGDEGEDQQDRAQGQAGDAAGYKLRKGP